MRSSSISFQVSSSSQEGIKTPFLILVVLLNHVVSQARIFKAVLGVVRYFRGSLVTLVVVRPSSCTVNRRKTLIGLIIFFGLRK